MLGQGPENITKIRTTFDIIVNCAFQKMEDSSITDMSSASIAQNHKCMPQNLHYEEM